MFGDGPAAAEVVRGEGACEPPAGGHTLGVRLLEACVGDVGSGDGHLIGPHQSDILVGLLLVVLALEIDVDLAVVLCDELHPDLLPVPPEPLLA